MYVKCIYFHCVTVCCCLVVRNYFRSGTFYAVKQLLHIIVLFIIHKVLYEFCCAIFLIDNSFINKIQILFKIDDDNKSLN